MTTPRPAAVIVLAAGEGTRMKSATPKVLHSIGGRTLLGHALAAARGVDPLHLAVVVRHGRDLVAAHIAEVDPDAVIAEQDDVKGTGRATECALYALPADLAGTVLVTCGDVPLLTAETLRGLLQAHAASGSAATVITATLPDPFGYGRIIRAADGSVAGIVEQKDATEAQREITEVNSGLYAFDVAVLRAALAEVGTDNVQGEKYLTDVLGIAGEKGLRVSAHLIRDLWQTEGVNDRVQLSRLGAELNRRIVEGWMRAGVTVIDPATTWIDADVRLGRDVIIHQQTQIHGVSIVGDDVVLGPDTTLTDVSIGDGAAVIRTHGSLSVIGAGALVGPFSYLRPGTELGAKGKIGTFVETKNAQIGVGSKVPHLTYVGDATIGEHSNIGASSVFVNYDGVSKTHTTIGSHCRTGSDNMFVAPVTVGDGAYTGAGTVVRRSVPPGALAINVAPQRNLLGWVHQKRAGTASAKAAMAATSALAASEQSPSVADDPANVTEGNATA
ncbi:MAG: bifunctional UDP-N-acetylglucosamine diphosphorylase/glucosamine-1-phosphate N-acetyltransferase GlmU [Dermatophilaceae bacterium]|nr:bifunctional UDP-N-acetylglucosamine diphosphorylase/glucosamine-1-phosphate N-acetyltransferase GlmU [Dermatophilaceae bacterium]